jgi:branched-chain amino acid transport system ATP-binding protein
MLQVSGLCVAYGRTDAVKSVDLTVDAGQIVCLLGANGAGKTTIMRTLSGLKSPRAGTIRFDTRDITGWPAHRIAALGLIQVPEGRQIFPGLTVRENLMLGAWLVRGEPERARRLDDILTRFPRLAERRDQIAGGMSGGEQQILALGRAMMSGPRLLLLDEPSMGLAPLIVDSIFAVLSDIRAAGTTILLVEQNASAALDIADSAYVLENGTITLNGTATEVGENPKVISAYLGG